MSSFFTKEKYLLYYESLLLYLRLELKLKRVNLVSEFNQSQWLKPYVELNTLKKGEAEKNGVKGEKLLYKLMNGTIKNLRKKIDVKHRCNQRLFKMDIKTRRYVAQNI